MVHCKAAEEERKNDGDVPFLACSETCRFVGRIGDDQMSSLALCDFGFADNTWVQMEMRLGHAGM